MESTAVAYWQDKVAIVTGGSAGLGYAIAAALLSAGAKVVIAARNENRLTAAVSILAADNAEVSGIVADVTHASDVQRLIEDTVAKHGRLDCLVNNAGKSMRGDVLTTPPEVFRELFEANFLAALQCVQAAAPQLIASGGHVVNIGSLASKTTSRFLGAYPASKFPLAALSQQLRWELGPQGVHTLLVCPGPLQRDDAGSRYADQASSLPAEASQPGGGVKLRGLDPQRLAHHILRACERRQAELVVPGKARLLFAISQLWPDLGDWITTKMTRGK